MLNRPLHILVVDDNPGDLFLVEELLHDTKLDIHAIEKAGTAAAAIEVLQQSNIDLVLLDLSLPETFGIETFLQVNQFAGAIPVVILSGLSDTTTATEAISLGAQDFLLKGEFNEKLLEKSIRYSLERKLTMKELELSNERYELVSKATNDMVWDWDFVNDKVYRNAEQFVQMLKWPAVNKDGGSKFWLSIIHPDDQFVHEKLLSKIKGDKTKNQFEQEYRLLTGEETYIYVLDKGYVVRDQYGDILRIIGALRNVTEQKKAEESLRLSEEKYRSLFNNIPASIFIWDIEYFKIVEANQTASEQYGYSREELLQMNMLQLRRKEDYPLFKSFVKEVSSGCFNSTSRLWKHRHKSGEEMYMQIVSNKIEYNQRHAVMSIATNVTEKVKLEKKLKEEKENREFEITRAVIQAQEKEREEIGRELHDNVNQILASSRLYLGLVKEKGSPYKNYIEESDRFISNAIHEIRQLSHVLIPPAMQDTDLEKSINTLIHMVQEGSGILVVKEISIHNHSLLNDQLKLAMYRILQEQMNNVLKYAKATEVIIRLLQTDEKIILQIKDNGIGFNLAQHTEGVGLLNIRTRASLQNGEVKIMTAPGKGCELLVQFHQKKN